MVSTWRSLYLRERDQLLLARLRWCAGLATLGSVLLAIQSLVLAAPTMQVVLAFAVVYSAASVTTWALSHTPVARRAAMALALVYVGVLIAAIAEQYALVSNGAGLAPAGFVALMVGVIVLLPWGAPPQSTVALASLVGYGWVLAHAPSAPNLEAMGLVISMAVVSVAGAELIERYRARSFERTWQQEELVALARDL